MFKRSDMFFTAAVVISLALSVWLWFGGQREEGLFVGIWVPSLIGVAIYVKLLSGQSK